MDNVNVVQHFSFVAQNKVVIPLLLGSVYQILLHVGEAKLYWGLGGADSYALAHPSVGLICPLLTGFLLLARLCFAQFRVQKAREALISCTATWRLAYCGIISKDLAEFTSSFFRFCGGCLEEERESGQLLEYYRDASKAVLSTEKGVLVTLFGSRGTGAVKRKSLAPLPTSSSDLVDLRDRILAETLGLGFLERIRSSPRVDQAHCLLRTLLFLSKSGTKLRAKEITDGSNDLVVLMSDNVNESLRSLSSTHYDANLLRGMEQFELLIGILSGGKENATTVMKPLRILTRILLFLNVIVSGLMIAVFTGDQNFGIVMLLMFFVVTLFFGLLEVVERYEDTMNAENWKTAFDRLNDSSRIISDNMDIVGDINAGSGNADANALGRSFGTSGRSGRSANSIRNSLYSNTMLDSKDNRNSTTMSTALDEDMDSRTVRISVAEEEESLVKESPRNTPKTTSASAALLGSAGLGSNVGTTYATSEQNIQIDMESMKSQTSFSSAAALLLNADVTKPNVETNPLITPTPERNIMQDLPPVQKSYYAPNLQTISENRPARIPSNQSAVAPQNATVNAGEGDIQRTAVPKLPLSGGLQDLGQTSLNDGYGLPQINPNYMDSRPKPAATRVPKLPGAYTREARMAAMKIDTPSLLAHAQSTTRESHITGTPESRFMAQVATLHPDGGDHTGLRPMAQRKEAAVNVAAGVPASNASAYSAYSEREPIPSGFYYNDNEQLKTAKFNDPLLGEFLHRIYAGHHEDDHKFIKENAHHIEVAKILKQGAHRHLFGEDQNLVYRHLGEEAANRFKNEVRAKSIEGNPPQFYPEPSMREPSRYYVGASRSYGNLSRSREQSKSREPSRTPTEVGSAPVEGQPLQGTRLPLANLVMEAESTELASPPKVPRLLRLSDGSNHNAALAKSVTDDGHHDGADGGFVSIGVDSKLEEFQKGDPKLEEFQKFEELPKMYSDVSRTPTHCLTPTCSQADGDKQASLVDTKEASLMETKEASARGDHGEAGTPEDIVSQAEEAETKTETFGANVPVADNSVEKLPSITHDEEIVQKNPDQTAGVRKLPRLRDEQSSLTPSRNLALGRKNGANQENHVVGNTVMENALVSDVSAIKTIKETLNMKDTKDFRPITLTHLGETPSTVAIESVAQSEFRDRLLTSSKSNATIATSVATTNVGSANVTGSTDAKKPGRNLPSFGISLRDEVKEDGSQSSAIDTIDVLKRSHLPPAKRDFGSAKKNVANEMRRSLSNDVKEKLFSPNASASTPRVSRGLRSSRSPGGITSTKNVTSRASSRSPRQGICPRNARAPLGSGRWLRDEEEFQKEKQRAKIWQEKRREEWLAEEDVSPKWVPGFRLKDQLQASLEAIELTPKYTPEPSRVRNNRPPKKQEKKISSQEPEQSSPINSSPDVEKEAIRYSAALVGEKPKRLRNPRRFQEDDYIMGGNHNHDCNEPSGYSERIGETTCGNHKIGNWTQVEVQHIDVEESPREIKVLEEAIGYNRMGDNRMGNTAHATSTPQIDDFEEYPVSAKPKLKDGHHKMSLRTELDSDYRRDILSKFLDASESTGTLSEEYKSTIDKDKVRSKDVAIKDEALQKGIRNFQEIPDDGSEHNIEWPIAPEVAAIEVFAPEVDWPSASISPPKQRDRTSILLDSIEKAEAMKRGENINEKVDNIQPPISNKVSSIDPPPLVKNQIAALEVDASSQSSRSGKVGTMGRIKFKSVDAIKNRLRSISPRHQRPGSISPMQRPDISTVRRPDPAVVQDTNSVQNLPMPATEKIGNPFVERKVKRKRGERNMQPSTFSIDSESLSEFSHLHGDTPGGGSMKRQQSEEPYIFPDTSAQKKFRERQRKLQQQRKVQENERSVSVTESLDGDGQVADGPDRQWDDQEKRKRELKDCDDNGQEPYQNPEEAMFSRRRGDLYAGKLYAPAEAQFVPEAEQDYEESDLRGRYEAGTDPMLDPTNLISPLVNQRPQEELVLPGEFLIASQEGSQAHYEDELRQIEDLV